MSSESSVKNTFRCAIVRAPGPRRLWRTGHFPGKSVEDQRTLTGDVDQRIMSRKVRL